MESDFYPRSPCGERRNTVIDGQSAVVFLSTLSLRRATAINGRNPDVEGISIHALLAESDLEQSSSYNAYLEISIHALLAESDDAINGRNPDVEGISIHALLAESDQLDGASPLTSRTFLSTLSLRRATS